MEVPSFSENGAGKSTMMKILSGAYKKDSGTIFFEGKEVDITGPKFSEELGIAIIYQELNLIHRVSVAENVFLGRPPRRAGVIQWGRMYRDAKALFDGFDIKMDVYEDVRRLSIAATDTTGNDSNLSVFKTEADPV